MLLWLAFPVVSGQMRGIWNVPLNLDFMARLLIVAVGSWSFLIWRSLDGVGYEFHFSAATARDGLLNFAGFSVLALPLGLTIRFITWNPHWRGSWTLLFDFMTIFIFIAVTEELYFRGLVQNLLENTWRSRYGAQAFTSVLFGFSHIHHAPFPNWRYVILASVAGWFYGSAWRKNRSLMASATTHALVDTVWRTWFTLPRI
ncbi:MAG: CPBP family intramembrane metalloprotease [Acidobacteria bacterium]|nr:CPBP family intramembrane metalloprotease [Acidobacteriota bacterium]